MTHILVLVHSQGGNCLTLAEQALKGAESRPGMTAQLKRVPDLEEEEHCVPIPGRGASTQNASILFRWQA